MKKSRQFGFRQRMYNREAQNKESVKAQRPSDPSEKLQNLAGRSASKPFATLFFFCKQIFKAKFWPYFGLILVKWPHKTNLNEFNASVLQNRWVLRNFQKDLLSQKTLTGVWKCASPYSIMSNLIKSYLKFQEIDRIFKVQSNNSKRRGVRSWGWPRLKPAHLVSSDSWHVRGDRRRMETWWLPKYEIND